VLSGAVAECGKMIGMLCDSDEEGEDEAEGRAMDMD